MPLTVLKTQAVPLPTDLIRFYLRTERLWAEHLAEPTELDVGTAACNPQLSSLEEANQIIDARVPPGMSAAEAVAMGSAFFEERGARCLSWTLNPAADESEAAALIEALQARGFTPFQRTVMHLPRRAAADTMKSELRFMSARASFRHARQLLEEHAEMLSTDSSVRQHWVDAGMLHLDDPHWDSIIAWDGTRAIGMAGVLIAGEVGRIGQLIFSTSHQSTDVSQLLLSRVVEICARSQLKHVLMEEHQPEATRFGFKPVGEFTSCLPR